MSVCFVTLALVSNSMNPHFYENILKIKARKKHMKGDRRYPHITSNNSIFNYSLLSYCTDQEIDIRNPATDHVNKIEELLYFDKQVVFVETFKKLLKDDSVQLNVNLYCDTFDIDESSSQIKCLRSYINYLGGDFGVSQS